MQVTINRSDLTRELALLAGVAAKQSTIPILSSVCIVADGGAVRLTCTDLECGVISTMPATVKESGAVCVGAKRILDFVRTLTGESFELAIGPNNYLTVKCGKSRARIPGTSADSFPELPAPPAPVLTLDARALARQFGRVAFAISTEQSRFTTNGLSFELKGGALRCVATDGHRLSLAVSDAPQGKDTRFIVPHYAVATLAKIADGAEGGAAADLAHDDNHLYFTVGPRVMMARKLAGTFPDYERILPKEWEVRATVEADALKAALDSVKQFGEVRDKGGVSRTAALTFTAGELAVSAATLDAGECDTSIACEYDGEELKAGFNPDYISEFLAAAGAEKIEAYIRDGKSAMEMRPAGDASYRYIVMPKRI